MVDRQKGSHIIFRQAQPPFRRVTVPDHRELAKGTLRAILREVGLTSDELVGLLWMRMSCTTGRMRHILRDQV